MKRLVYVLMIAVIASVTFSSCSRKALTQEEIDDFNRQISEKLEQIENKSSRNIDTITIDSTGTDSIVKTDADNNSKKTEITIIQGHNDGEHAGEVLIVFIAIVTPFACVVLIVFMILRTVTTRQRERNNLIEKAIENNYTLPHDFFASYRNARTRLQSALVWLAWGVGIMAFFLIISDETVYAIGIIPLLVGVAKLITYFVEDRKKEGKQ